MADKKFIEAVLKSHNEYRSRHQAESLSLNKDLSESAQKWADHLAMTNSFEHSNASHKGEKLGENIAMKSSSKPDFYSGQEATDQWYNEIEQYTFGSGSGSSGTGHFSQVVWKGSKELGVGKAQTRDGNMNKIIVVAQYRPAGNMMGDHPKNVLPPKDGKIIMKEKPPAEQTIDGQQVGTHSDTSSDGEFRSVRTHTVTEGAGSNKVTKIITEETIIKANGDKIVNTTEKVTSGGQ